MYLDFEFVLYTDIMSLHYRQRIWVCIVDWNFKIVLWTQILNFCNRLRIWFYIVDGDSEFADPVNAAADDGGWQGGGGPGSRRSQPRNLVWIYQRYRQVHSGRKKGSPAPFIRVLLSGTKVSWIYVLLAFLGVYVRYSYNDLQCR